jgi:catechol 2,3-dioxygenase-like lactoylglutathione lyase family enzyme
MSDADHDTGSQEPGPAVPPLSHFHHVGLTVRDVERSEVWYRDVLGFVRAFAEPHPGGAGYAVVMMRPGTALDIGLDHHDDNAGEVFKESRTGLDHVSMAVERRDDLDRWAEHFDRLGVARGDVTDCKIGPVTFATLGFRDPDNIQLELIWQQ